MKCICCQNEDENAMTKYHDMNGENCYCRLCKSRWTVNHYGETIMQTRGESTPVKEPEKDKQIPFLMISLEGM